MGKLILILSFILLPFLSLNAQQKDTWADDIIQFKKEAQRAIKGELPYFSKVKRYKDTPEPVSFDIKGLNQLVLTSWGTNDGPNYDHAVWANARVTKASGEVVYLSKEMMSYGHTGWDKPRFDINAQGKGIQINGKSYEKGVFLHAEGLAIFELGGKYVRFEADLGMEQNAQTGSAVLSIQTTNPEPLLSKLNKKYPKELMSLEQYLPKGIMPWLLSKDNKQEELVIASLIKVLSNNTSLTKEFKDVQKLTDGSLKLKKYLNLIQRASNAIELKEQIDLIDIESIAKAFQDMKQMPGYKVQDNQKLFDYINTHLNDVKNNIETASPEALAKAQEICEARRALLLSNPVLDFDKLVAVKYKLGDKARTAMGPQIGTRSNNWSSHPTQRKTGFDCEIVELTNLRGELNAKTLYKSNKTAPISDINLHWDADRMMFSSIGENDRWQVFEMAADGSGLKEVVKLEEDDLDFFEGTYLPSGKIIVNSTVGYHGVPCVNGADQVANLGLYDPKTNNYRRLNFGQDSDWDPVVMNNGRVMYLRWEYTDLTHYFSRIMMHMNPDGTNKKELYGSGSFWPNAMFDAQPLPGKDNNQFVAIVSGHHGIARSGRMVTFDPKKGRMEDQGVMQEFPRSKTPVDPIIKDHLVNGVWPQFLNPKPLSDKYFLVTAKLNPNALWGLYLIDVYDNMTPIVMHEGEAISEAVPVIKKEIPPVIPERVNLKDKEATIYIQDLYEGIGTKGLPKGSIKELRVFAYEFAYVRSPSNHMAQGIQSGWDIKRLLGTVPVEEDGSVTFKVPANVPISLQPLDEEGAALQWMRSWFTAMPGEVLSCVGCHEDQNSIAKPQLTIASRKSPIDITTPEGGVRSFTFDLEVQPLLDKRCVACHNNDSKPGRPNFEDTSLDPGLNMMNHQMSKSYLALHPYVHRQGPEADIKVLRPMEYHASSSELIQLLKKGHYNVELDPEEWKVLYNWIDFNAPYNGSFKANPLFEYDQVERRKELMLKYNNLEINWEKEIEDYKAYLAAKGEITPVRPERTEKPKYKSLKSKKFPFSIDEAQQKQQNLKPNKKEIELAQGVKLQLTRIPSGEFLMGSNHGQADEAPQSKVKIEKDFWIGSFEITNEQFAVFFPEHDSRYTDQYWKDHVHPGYPSNLPNQPVIRISWDEAMSFCKQLSMKTGLKVSLPTEAQWEWVARNGQESNFWYGANNADFSAYENLADDQLRNMAVIGIDPQPMPESNKLKNYFDFIPRVKGVDDGQMIAGDVGRYKPSPWGVYDLYGNVQEWTRSDYVSYPYKDKDGRNDGNSNMQKVVRGGSWRDRPTHASASYRRYYQPYQKVYNVGFRIVVEEE